MIHVLALAMAHGAPPGVFKAFGIKMPTVVGEIVHWIAHTLVPFAIHWTKLLVSLFIIFLMMIVVTLFQFRRMGTWEEVGG